MTAAVTVAAGYTCSTVGCSYSTWLLYNGIELGPQLFIYFTEWSYLAWCCYLIISAFSTTMGIIRMGCTCNNGLASTNDVERSLILEGQHHQNWGAIETPVELSNTELHQTSEEPRPWGGNETCVPSTDGAEIEKRNTAGIVRKVQWLGHKIQWVLYYLGINNALFVTLLFWIVVYGISHNITRNELSPVVYQVHGVNAFFAVIDIFVIGIPMNILHVVFPIAFGIVYAVFSVIYYSAHGIDEKGHRYVYIVLDWSKPGKAFGFVLLCVVVEVVLYACVYGLYCLRNKLASCTNRTPNQD